MSTYFFPNIVLPTVNAIKLIENFYADADEDSMSRSLTIANTFYASEEPNHTTVLCFENRPSKRRNIHLKHICKKKPLDIDLEQQLDSIKYIGRFFHKISLEIAFDKNFATTLSHITSHCAQLNYLNIRGSGEKSEKEEIFACNEGSTKSYNVKTLVLTNCTLFQRQLSYIIGQLPQLKELVLKNCLVHSHVFGHSYSSIALSYSSLDLLGIDITVNLNNRLTKKEVGYFIKLTTFTDKTPHYCFLTAVYNRNIIVGYNLIGNLTEFIYHEIICNKRIPIHYYNYLVCCQSIKKFTIKYSSEENGRDKSIDLLSD
jgi:hypothetical protein